MRVLACIARKYIILLAYKQHFVKKVEKIFFCAINTIYFYFVIGISTIIEKASGGVTGGNSTRKQSNTVTQVSSSVCEAPGLDNVELR